MYCIPDDFALVFMTSEFVNQSDVYAAVSVMFRWFSNSGKVEENRSVIDKPIDILRRTTSLAVRCIAILSVQKVK